MRELFWRGAALALAGCISWLLWHWPEPVEPVPVEFVLDECTKDVPIPEDRWNSCFMNKD